MRWIILLTFIVCAVCTYCAWQGSNDFVGGELNHAFKFLCPIRLVGKRVKAWNRTVYTIVKWLGGDLLQVPRLDEHRPLHASHTSVSDRTPCAPRISTPSISAVADGPVTSTA